MEHVRTVRSVRRVHGHQEHCTIDCPNLNDCLANRQLKQQTKERRRGEGKEQRSRCDLAVRPVTTSPPLQSQTAARNALKHK